MCKVYFVRVVENVVMDHGRKIQSGVPLSDYNLRARSRWFNRLKFAPIVFAQSFQSHCPTAGPNFSATVKNYPRSSDLVWLLAYMLFVVQHLLICKDKQYNILHFFHCCLKRDIGYYYRISEDIRMKKEVIFLRLFCFKYKIIIHYQRPNRASFSFPKWRRVIRVY